MLRVAAAAIDVAVAGGVGVAVSDVVVGTCCLSNSESRTLSLQISSHYLKKKQFV